jgi:hypothetical protein
MFENSRVRAAKAKYALIKKALAEESVELAKSRYLQLHPTDQLIGAAKERYLRLQRARLDQIRARPIMPRRPQSFGKW